MRPVRRIAAVVATAVAAMLAGGGWWALRSAAPAASDATTSAATSTASARLPKAAPGAEPAASLPPPVPTEPLAEVAERFAAQSTAQPSADFAARRLALERRARDGDADAAAELGNLLLTCSGYFEMDDADVDAMLVEGIARFGHEALQLPASVPLDGVADSTRRYVAQMRDTCAGSQGLSLSRQERRDALDGLRRGALAGNRAAMTNFARLAFDEFDDPRAMIAHPERVRERKREARGWLDRAVAAGDAEALEVAAQAYYAGSFLEKSNESAYANFYAYTRAHAGDAANARGYEADLAMYGDGLTPGQLAQARQRGEAIYAACCAARPGGAR